MPFPVNKIEHVARAWIAGARASVTREMEFRVNFFLGLIRQFLWLAAFIFLIEIIFRNTTSLSGWGREEVLTILALSRIVEGIMNTLFIDNIMRLNDHVQKGTLDFILIKPLPGQFAAFFSRISLGNIGNIFVGMALLAYAAMLDPSLISLPKNAVALMMIIAGIAAYYSLLIIVATLVFYLERFQTLWAFQEIFSEPLTVPFDVFPRPVRWGLTYLIPLAFVVFVPAQVLTDRLSLWQIPLAIGIASVFLVAASIAWRAGIRRYTSASS